MKVAGRRPPQGRYVAVAAGPGRRLKPGLKAATAPVSAGFRQNRPPISKLDPWASGNLSTFDQRSTASHDRMARPSSPALEAARPSSRRHPDQARRRPQGRDGTQRGFAASLPYRGGRHAPRPIHPSRPARRRRRQVHRPAGTPLGPLLDRDPGRQRGAAPHRLRTRRRVGGGSAQVSGEQQLRGTDTPQTLTPKKFENASSHRHLQETSPSSPPRFAPQPDQSFLSSAP